MMRSPARGAAAGVELSKAPMWLRRALGPATSFADQAFASVCNFLTTIVLARSLGLEGFGVYSMVWLAVYLAMNLQLGLIVSPMMSIGSKREGPVADAYYVVILLHQAVYTLLATAAIFGALSALEPFRLDGDLPLAGALCAAAYLMQDFLRRFLFTRGRPSAVLLIDMLNQGLKLGVLAVLWQDDLVTVDSALLTVAGAAAASAIAGMAVAGPLRWRRRVFAEITARQWRSARWLVLTGTVQWLLSYSGLLVTAGLLGPTVLGALRAAQSVLAVLNVVREALENILPPLIGRAMSVSGVPGVRKTVVVALLLAALTGCVIVLALKLTGPWLLRQLYGGEIVAYDWVIVWYACAFPMALVSLVLGCAFRALEKTRPIFVSALVGACFNILTVYPAAVAFGVAGIISVTLASEFVVLTMLAVLARGSGLFEAGRADARHDGSVIGAAVRLP